MHCVVRNVPISTSTLLRKYVFPSLPPFSLTHVCNIMLSVMVLSAGLSILPLYLWWQHCSRQFKPWKKTSCYKMKNPKYCSDVSPLKKLCGCSTLSILRCGFPPLVIKYHFFLTRQQQTCMIHSLTCSNRAPLFRLAHAKVLMHHFFNEVPPLRSSRLIASQTVILIKLKMHTRRSTPWPIYRNSKNRVPKNRMA